MTDQELVIDEELSRILPALTDDEKEDLEANLVKDGRCTDPIIYWHEDGKNLIVDGMHRWPICRRLGIPYHTEPMVFADRNEAKLWILNRQLGRRNLLTPAAIRKIRGELYNAIMQKHGCAKGGDRRSEVFKGQICALKSDLATASLKTGISDAKLQREGKIVELIDAFPKTLRQSIETGKTKATDSQVKAIAKADENAQMQVARDIRTGKQPDLAKAMAAAGIKTAAKKPIDPKTPKLTKPTTVVEHVPSPAGCAHEHKCWCPNCGLTYCTNCDPDHEAECRVKRDAIEAADSKTDEKRYKEARRAMGVLVRWFDSHGQTTAAKPHLETLAHLLG